MQLPSGGGFLDGLLGAAGGVANTLGNLLSNSSPEQQQRASSIAMAIMQPQQQRAPLAPPPAQFLPPVKASPVLIANADENRRDFGPMPADLLNSYKPMEPQYDARPVEPDALPPAQPTPAMPAGMTQQMPPLAPPMPIPMSAPQGYPQQGFAPYPMQPVAMPYGMAPQPVYTPELAQARAMRARLNQLTAAQLQGYAPPPMSPAPPYPGAGRPHNWRERIGNALEGLHQSVSPQYAQQQYNRYQHDLAANAAANQARLQFAQQQDERNLKLLEMLNSGANMQYQNETNLAGREFGNAQGNQERWQDPNTIRQWQNDILKTTDADSTERMSRIFDVYRLSGGMHDWRHMMSMKGTDREEGMERGRELRNARTQQQIDTSREENPFRLRKLQASTTAAEAAAAHVNEQQQARTTLMNEQAKLAGLNRRLKETYGDAQARASLNQEQRQVQQQAFQALNGLKQSHTNNVRDFDRYQMKLSDPMLPQDSKSALEEAAKVGTLTPRQQLRSQIEARFGAVQPIAASAALLADPFQPKEGLTRADQVARRQLLGVVRDVLGDNASNEEARTFLKSHAKEIAGMSQLLPKQVLTSQMFLNFGYKPQLEGLSQSAWQQQQAQDPTKRVAK